ncbi:extracellular solute-binding protein [Paenibacillus eucommiae]|uniref:ABC-type glycerol-3-phosphate transport system substrate-binding protein n=1 Tax=Paenibacillus eucommiae TaxID=1355755 RepID=A0ABS4IT12_9BACL|nr:extracellular solute-binding protein [Paenibacillus eucommiae]MBP1990702.1 ABC-type glycerol-3-phosphate transport system substrate-binding protein [Paenibacillus eucommiae]
MLKRWQYFGTLLLSFMLLFSMTFSSSALPVNGESSQEASSQPKEVSNVSVDESAIGPTVESANESANDRASDIPTYLQWLASTTEGAKDTAALREPLMLPAHDSSGVSDEVHFEQLKDGEGVVWKQGEGWIEWQVELPEAGYYNLGVIYDSADDHMTDLVRGIQIDGALPYAEAERIVLKRHYADNVFPPERDEFDNDKRPKSIEIKGWKNVLLTDYAVDSKPLKWLFTKGTHTIRLISGREAMKLQGLYVLSPQASEATQVPQNPDQDKEPQDPDLAKASNLASGNWLQKIEAEQFTQKSNVSIQLQSNESALISPAAKGHIRYNTIGGDQFRRSGEWIEWEFNVPKDGIYHIGFKYLQAYANNAYAYRTITIDGKSPFKELLEVGFPYNSSWDWDSLTLSDADNQPLQLQLEQGKHTIRMTANAAPVMPVYEGLLRNLRSIGKLEQTIRKITGNFEKSYTSAGNTDFNRDWELEKYIPGLHEQMTGIIDDLLAMSNHLAGITTGRSDIENAFRAAANDLTDLRDHPRTIPNRLNLFETMQNNLGTWTYRLLDQPLLLDYLWIAEPGAELPRVKPNWLEKTGHFLLGFFRSFTNDYDFVRKRSDAIDVWVNRNRDYVNVIQQLADEQFTAQTGIAVNINIVPDPQLFILGNISGKQPDVALGVDTAMPIDFATRGALVDLSQFPDYEEAAKLFHPGALSVFHYDKKDYALPEIQGFNVLLYRTDIMERLELSPPDTWDDVLKMLPTLQQNGFDFYIPPKDGLPFIYQQGASFYSADGMRSALDSEEALQGFEQWTDMFALYQMPKEVPSFYSHFRLGDIPIGVVDFNTYLQVQFAAPELAGRWKIAPIPGTKQADGTIARWSGGAMQAGVIFKQSKKQEDAWEFLKWWTSTDMQRRFGNDIEALYGPEYRWNTANVEAFTQLPWPMEDIQTISDQREWFKEIPQLPGGYFTGRHLEIAWNKVVLERKNPRVAMEQAVNDINRELERKQVEFGLRNREGDILHPLDVPQINQPWKGGAP